MNYLKRIINLQDFCRQKQIDAIFITSPANLIYFSGFIPLDVTDREAYLLITQKNAYILTSKLYADEVKNYIKHCILKEISSFTPVTKIIAAISKEENIKTIGFEEHNITFAEYQRFAKENIPLVPIFIDYLRVEKDSQEIEYIAEACKIGDDAFEFILGKIKPGITEEMLAFELEIFLRKKHTIPSFPTIVAFGKNAAVPHHITGNTKLENSQFILLDFGVKIQNYCSDMTRTIYIGKPSFEQKKLYNTVLESQLYAIEYITNIYSTTKSVRASEVDKIARNHIVAQEYPSFPHTLGHGIGIQVHEGPSLSPNSYDTLGKGMVFSVEPGIYITDEIGVRIEDLIALEHEDVKKLTQSSSKLTTL